ncbi:LexA family protein [Streptomyces sp. NPDC050400]|uniref:LexA family protein n=1 Tax=Streptomyces sp. NPDC050400 TaxID=3365610 RepID=UPI003799E2F9
MPDLTERQHAILDFVRSWIREHREPPTLARIGAAVGLRSRSAVHYQLRQLETLSRVRIVNGKAEPIEWDPLAALRGRRRPPGQQGAYGDRRGPVRRDMGRPAAPPG